MIGQLWALPVPLILLPTRVCIRGTLLPRKPRRTCVHIISFLLCGLKDLSLLLCWDFESPFPI